MRTRVVAAVLIIGLAVGLGWYVLAQDASSPGVQTFVPGQVLTAAQLNTSFGALLGALTGATSPSIVQVHCETGDTIARALQMALPGTTLQVTGTCKETVTMTTNRLTLDGQGTAIIDGGGGAAPVVTIDRAQGVTMAGVTVQNGYIGMLGRRDADVTVRRTTAQGKARFVFQALVAGIARS